MDAFARLAQHYVETALPRPDRGAGPDAPPQPVARRPIRADRVAGNFGRRAVGAARRLVRKRSTPRATPVRSPGAIPGG